ncbi:MAG: DMT family transporter [Beijerinckiaceae bacterium]
MFSPGSRAGLVAALISAVAFGVNIVGAKLTAGAGISAPLLVFYRTLVMLLLVGAALLLFQRKPTISRNAWIATATLGATSAAMGLAYLSSVAFIPVTVAAVIFYTYPILIVLVSPWATGVPLRPQHLLIALVAFIGVSLVVGPGLGALDWRGLALALAASVMTTSQFLVANRVAKESTLAKLFWVQLIVAGVSAIAASSFGALAGPASLAAEPVGVAITLVGYVIGSAGLIYALSRLSAVIAGLVFCLEPVVSAIASALILDETMNAVQYAGGALVLIAVACAMLAPANKGAPV